MSQWRPTATLHSLQKRAALLAAIRSHFSGNALEVEVPCLGTHGVTDLHIDNIPATVNGRPAFLQSSPEYFLKRLLAAGSGDLYYLGKVFRDGEAGRRHNAEFTMLEWYRLGWDEQCLMEEVATLLSRLAGPMPVTRFHYGDIFAEHTGLDPHRAETDALRQRAGQLSGSDFNGESRATCLDLIFSLTVEPQLPNGLTLIDNYPACQCALAQLGRDSAANTVALRFEAFIDGVELANGYRELADPVELRARFEGDNAQRQAAGKNTMAVDERFMAAMQQGLPECSGVALGIDRLLMYLADTDNIQNVLAFPFI